MAGDVASLLSGGLGSPATAAFAAIGAHDGMAGAASTELVHGCGEGGDAVVHGTHTHTHTHTHIFRRCQTCTVKRRLALRLLSTITMPVAGLSGALLPDASHRGRSAVGL